ncbi:hypothetical protein QFZ68_003302 [Streptomyces sp. V1I6]|nr:hypothetical protein [Streptomyces sp. V1I6]
MAENDLSKPGRKWTSAERWQFTLGAVGVLVTLIATVGQFVR